VVVAAGTVVVATAARAIARPHRILTQQTRTHLLGRPRFCFGLPGIVSFTTSWRYAERVVTDISGGSVMSSLKSALLIAGILVASIASAADAPSTASVQDRAAIQNLIAKYAFALDTLNADMYAAVFAPDADLTFGGNTYKGRDKIHGVVTSIKERRAAQPASDKPAAKSYHVITNTLIEFTDDTHANHRSYWQTVSGPSSGPFTVGGAGVYQDTIVKVKGEWLIQKRDIIQ